MNYETVQVGSATSSQLDQYAAGYTIPLAGSLRHTMGFNLQHNETLVRGRSKKCRAR